MSEPRGPATAAERGRGCVLAFDYGTRTIGVAVGEPLIGDARPLATVTVSRGGPDWQAIARIVEDWKPGRAVVGVPAHADGTAHPLAGRIARFCRQLEGRYGIAVTMVDERLSSRAGRASHPEAAIDAAAAAVILQSWFNARRAPH